MSRNKYDGTYSLNKVEDIGHRLSKGELTSLSVDKSDHFINLIGLSLTKQNIESISGVYYLAFQGYIKYYNLNIHTKDGRTYTAIFIQPNYNNNTNYDDLRLLSCTLSVDWSQINFDNSSFEDLKNPSVFGAKIMDIRQMRINSISEIDESSFRLQVSTNSPTICRATFKAKVYPSNDVNSLSTRVEVVYERNNFN